MTPAHQHLTSTCRGVRRDARVSCTAMGRLAALGLLFLACAAHPAAAAGLYKWTDADGQVHYGERPPPGTEAESLRPPPPVDSDAAREKLGEQERYLDDRLRARREAAASAKQAEAEAAERRARCEKAKAELQRIREARRVFEADATGARSSQLDEEGRAKRIAEKEKYVEEACAPPRPPAAAAPPKAAGSAAAPAKQAAPATAR